MEENFDVKDEIKKKRKDEWIETWFSIEAMAAKKEVVEESLKTHIGKIEKSKGSICVRSSVLGNNESR